MREIKFKYGFSNGTDCFYKDFTLSEIEEGRQFDEISDSPLLSDYKIVSRSQYTELKDTNGKEICEGDIIKFTVDDTDIVKSISFYKGAFVVPGKHCNYIFFSSLLTTYPWVTGITVIGNIYENPELLENDNEKS